MKTEDYKVGDYIRWNDQIINDAREQNWLVNSSLDWWQEIHQVTFVGKENFGSNEQFVYLG